MLPLNACAYNTVIFLIWYITFFKLSLLTISKKTTMVILQQKCKYIILRAKILFTKKKKINKKYTKSYKKKSPQ